MRPMSRHHLTFSAVVTRVGLVAALFAAACSSDSTTPSPATTTTTTTTAPPCAFAIGSTTVNANGGGDTVSVNVGTSAATCAWTAVSNASFITIKSGAAGTGNGTVVLTIAPNPGNTRSGTVTIGGQTVTVNQLAGLVAGFEMFDPASQPGPTTDCRFRSLSSGPSTCTLRSTSFTFDATAITSYSWNIQYTYGSVKTVTGTGSTIDIVDMCGQAQATDDGVPNPLSVSLTITDAKGTTATATAGSGTQPAMSVRLYNCGV
jgi:hypothetical protein